MPCSPLVSVIVPIYNVEAFLDQCLASIQSQTLTDIEVLCINDGSTDNSVNIIKKYTSSDNRFILIDKENEGYGASCNRGIDKARGSYLAIIEPDDYILPSMFKEMFEFAASFSEEIDLIKTAWVDVLNWDSGETFQTKPGYLYKRLKTSKQPFSLEKAPVLIEGHPSIWSALYRKAFLDEEHIRFRPYPGAGWADNPFLIETMAKAKRIVYLDKMFYHYRNDLSSTSKSNTSENAPVLSLTRWLEMADILKELIPANKAIWSAHYLRGFNYIDDLVDRENPSSLLSNKQVCEVFSHMDTHIVSSMKKVAPSKKQIFFEVLHTAPPSTSNFPYYTYLLKEFIHKVRVYGVKETIALIKNRSKGFAQDLPDKPTEN